MARKALLAGLVAAALWLSGCTNPALMRVQPWDRGTLADETMNPGRDPLSAGQLDHVYFSREAANGGKAVGGSGCGCN
ncbi:MAG TPA: DUF4266 domain-containing protein [Opitutaceae bacterium]|jgi:hypothetical protein|nr:DUF4266 domain-containing protein [Opitutaceae bacterium]